MTQHSSLVGGLGQALAVGLLALFLLWSEIVEPLQGL